MSDTYVTSDTYTTDVVSYNDTVKLYTALTTHRGTIIGRQRLIHMGTFIVPLIDLAEFLRGAMAGTSYGPRRRRFRKLGFDADFLNILII